ncbi:MAG: S9 family peptidase [Acidobacteriia bacterium]|nr:S9 family peptidase [Terriglobia bacterium]
MKRKWVVFFFLCLLYISVAAPIVAAPRAFTIDDVYKIRPVREPQISPDGKWVAYVVSVPSLEKNRGNTDVWLTPSGGGEARQLTTSEKRDDTPRWSPDGKQLAFISTRGGDPQIYLLDIAGGEARPLTSIHGGADGEVWSPNGKWLAFTASIYPECYSADYKKLDDCNKKKDEEREKNPVKARVVTRLLYRHWNAYADDKRSHVFIVPAAGGEPIDMTPGDYETPTFAVGGGGDFAFSPDSKELAYVSNHEKNEESSTNSDIFVVPVGGDPSKEAVKISTSPGADTSPVYSPDGRYIAWKTQARDGYESDLIRLALYDRQAKAVKIISDQWDDWIEQILWAPDSKSVFFTTDYHGNVLVMSVTVNGGPVKTVLSETGWHEGVDVSYDGKFVVTSWRDVSHPAEIFRADADGKNFRPLTHVNDALVAEWGLNNAEEHWVTSKDGAKIQLFVVKPFQFEANRKYPTVLIIHGGPQQMFGNAFRAEYQIYAQAGFVTAFSNPRGSPGYGQKFVEEISGDYSGKVYDDLMKVTDYLETLPYVDKGLMGATGGSFGGFMVDWIEGHTDRFKALIAHAGPSDQLSFFGTTEELWFPTWDLKGTPWTNWDHYVQMSPVKYAPNFKTPILITHGEMDYRVLIGQGEEMFTALQKMGVESKFIRFPDEGHWILKPQNSKFWYEQQLGWMKQHLMK